MQSGSPGDTGTCQEVTPGSGSFASLAECQASGCGGASPTTTTTVDPASLLTWQCIPYPGYATCCGYVGPYNGTFTSFAECQGSCPDQDCNYSPTCFGSCEWYSDGSSWSYLGGDCSDGCGCTVPAFLPSETPDTTVTVFCGTLP